MTSLSAIPGFLDTFMVVSGVIAGIAAPALIVGALLTVSEYCQEQRRKRNGKSQPCDKIPAPELAEPLPGFEFQFGIGSEIGKRALILCVNPKLSIRHLGKQVLPVGEKGYAEFAVYSLSGASEEIHSGANNSNAEDVQ